MTKPSRPVVGNNQASSFIGLLSDNKTSPHDFAVRAKRQIEKQILDKKIFKEKDRRKIIDYNITPYGYFMSEYKRIIIIH